MHSAAYIWAKIIGNLEERLGAIAVSALLDDAEIVKVTQDKLILYSPSDFRQETIRRSWKQYIEQAAAELFQTRLELVVWGDYEKEQQTAVKTDHIWTYNPHYSFENFIEGPSNRMPLRAAKFAAEHPGDDIYNPLYFYGPPGVGKTHLLYAIANSIAKNQPELNIVYVKGDQFTNELVQAIMHGHTAEFKKKYRKADVLLVDDVQFLAGKETTQEEFFHTFNALFDYHRQIVLTSDRKPSDMPTLEDRLKWRFGEGVMMGITPPDSETRKRIIKDKGQKLGLALDEECVEYASQMLCENVRQIEGGLKKIRAYRDLTGMELTLENIAQTIEDIQTAEQCAQITPELVVRYVCRYFGIEEAQLMGKQRSRNVALPRQIAMYLVRHMTGMSFPNIGRYFEKDQTTVQHSVKKVEQELRNKDTQLENILRDIQLAIDSSV